jgi:hypothetical protein
MLLAAVMAVATQVSMTLIAHPDRNSGTAAFKLTFAVVSGTSGFTEVRRRIVQGETK